MTKRIATRKLAGVESGADQNRSYRPARQPPPAPPHSRRPAAPSPSSSTKTTAAARVYHMTKDADRGGARRPRLLDRSQARYPAGRFARALPAAPRRRQRQVFPQGPEPPGHHHQRRNGALQRRVRRRRKARPQRGSAGARAGPHRPGGRAVPGIPKRRAMVRPHGRTKMQCRRQRPRAACGATTKTRSTSTPSAASSWWWMASAGRRPARRPPKSPWTASARAWSGRPAPPSSASAKPSPWPTTKSCRPRAPIRSGRAWPACSPLAVLENGEAVVGHVGDSRLYHIRRGEIRKITHDHSPVGEREDTGELTEAEGHAAPAPQRGLPRRGLGRARARRRRISSRSSASPSTPMPPCCCAATA